MKRFIVVLLVLLSCQLLFSQWTHQIFPDVSVLLSTDVIGNKAALGGWKLTDNINVRAYYSTDRGNNWIASQTPDSLRVIVKLQMMNENLVYGCGATNLPSIKDPAPEIVKNYLSDHHRRHLAKIGLFPENQVDYKGQFLQSTNSGQSWLRKGILPDSVSYLIDLNFTSETTGYVLATQPSTRSILKTTDGGLTWNYCNIPPEIMIYSISFSDSLNGFAAGVTINAAGVYIKTSDGGNNWEIYHQSLESVEKIRCLSSEKVIFLGYTPNHQPKVFLSLNNGNSWTNILSLPELTIADNIDGTQEGWIIVYGTQFSTGASIPFVNGSSDNGMTWHYSVLTPLTDLINIMTSSKLINDSEWFITATSMTPFGILLHTNNSGGLPVELISFSGEQSGENIKLEWVTASEINNYGFEIEKKSGNTGFHPIGFIAGKGTSTETQHYSFTDNIDGLSGTLTYRLKQIDYDGTFDYSKEIQVIYIPGGFSLGQNYPNPFNPNTTIKYSIGSNCMVTLKVFNILGTEVTTLINDYKQAGEYEIEFNASALSSGVYFYVIYAGDYKSIRKLQLLK